MGTRSLPSLPCLSTAQEWKFMETHFFYILTIHSDQISYVNHVLDPPYVFYTRVGCWRGDAGLGMTVVPPSLRCLADTQQNFQFFFDILTIHNDGISCLKHVLDPLCVLFTQFGCLDGGGGRGLGHNLLMQFSSLCSSKMEISKTDFVYILIIQNDQVPYVKHVLDPLYVFFTLFGSFFLGGGSQGGWGTTCSCGSPASAAQKWKFPKLSILMF